MPWDGIERRSGAVRRTGPADRRVATTYDMLAWITPNPAIMQGKHLEGNANPMYTVVDPPDANGIGKIHWVKGHKGWPADVELYDAMYIYHWATELDWSSNTDYKKTYNNTTIPLCARFAQDASFVLSTDSTIGVYNNCNLTKTFVLGDVRCEVHANVPNTVGGDIQGASVIEIWYRWGGQGHTDGIYNVQETYTLAEGYGLVGWRSQKWNGASYNPTPHQVWFNKIMPGTVVPNFPACP